MLYTDRTIFKLSVIKTKTIVITLTNHRRRKQYKEPNTCNRRQVRKNACELSTGEGWGEEGGRDPHPLLFFFPLPLKRPDTQVTISVSLTSA